MDDLLERLAAANPVRDCEPTSFDRVLERLQAEPASTLAPPSDPRAHRRIRRPLAWALGVVCPVLVAVAVILVGGGAAPSIAARAYAATSAGDGVVHYRTVLIAKYPAASVKIRNGRTISVAAKVKYRLGEVWVSATRSRVLWFNSDARGRRLGSPSENVVVGKRSWEYQPHLRVLLTGHVTSGAPDMVCISICPSGSLDPIAAFRRAYREHRLVSAGHVTRDGQTLDVLKTTAPDREQIYVDPRSSLPVEELAPIGYGRATLTISGYTRLALDGSAPVLRLVPHPNAKVLKVN